MIHTYTDEETYAHTRAGNNGQVQLWQFLLELLTSAEHLHAIRWHGEALDTLDDTTHDSSGDATQDT